MVACFLHSRMDACLLRFLSLAFFAPVWWLAFLPVSVLTFFALSLSALSRCRTLSIGITTRSPLVRYSLSLISDILNEIAL